MADTNHFYYDEEKCEFVRVTYEKRKKIVHTLSFWLINGIVLASMGIALLSHYVGTPAEIALKAENRALLDQLETTRSSILQLENQLGEISELDNEMYRSVLGMDPISEDERLAGTGGSDPYSHFDLYSEDTAEILRWTASRLDNLERRMGIQKMSFDEVKAFYNDNKEWLRNMPAIRPTNGIILSGYGMRTHPVLGYKRMHHGIDLRADIGTNVYATGDGVVKFAGRRGTYGNLLEIDHGNGYVTRYAHLSGFADGIRPGTRVNRGDLVALSGDTGVTQGPHLHYEVRLNGESLDPLNYLFADITPDEYQLYREIADSNPMSMD